MGSIRAVVLGVISAAITASAALADPPRQVPQSGPQVYVAVEGGWAWLNGQDVQTDVRFTDIGIDAEGRAHFLNVGQGWYWRGEAGVVLPGHASPGSVLGRLGIVVQGWKGQEREESNAFSRVLMSGEPTFFSIGTAGCITDDDQPCAYGQSSLERRYWEIALQVFGNVANSGHSRLWLGFEPAFGTFSERGMTKFVVVPPADPVVQYLILRNDLSARTFGVSLAAEGEFQVSQRLRLMTRAAAGYFIIDAGAATAFEAWDTSDIHRTLHARQLNSFRGQLGLGAEYDLTPKISFGVMGRLDYWSHMAVFRWPTWDGTSFVCCNHIATGKMLNGSVGGRLTFRTAAR